MTRRIHKVGPNDLCPCGSGGKYKACCRGQVDWELLIPQGLAATVPYLSTRGKNVLFINLLLEALQLDSDKPVITRPEFKRAFTSAAVKRIFEAVAFVWPSGEDLRRVLQREAKRTSGLYIGSYDPELVLRGVTRHSLYADRILLVDPLHHPATMREEFNPLEHPAMHRTTTLKWATMWLALAPWIEEGLVGFVRSPGDFYPGLAFESYTTAQARYQKHPELTQIANVYVEEQADDDVMGMKNLFLLSMPDHQVREVLREYDPDITEEKIAEAIAYQARRREEDPYYLEPEQPGKPDSELLHFSTGTNYEQAKMIAFQSHSYLMTDLPTRWREIEIDRADAGIDDDAWSPFAKAFHGLSFSFLDAVPLEAALTLRREGRLESMRSFLRKTWNATSKTGPFDSANVSNLAAELDTKVREADVEWSKIDRELVKLIAVTATAGFSAAGPAIASGNVGWLAAALAAAGVGGVVHSTMQRSEYKRQYPAGFFVDLKKGKYE